MVFASTTRRKATDLHWCCTKNDNQLVLLGARGYGGSDKPRTPEDYMLEKRVGDIVAVLNDLGIVTAHYFGYSMAGGSGSAWRVTLPSGSDP
jgi:pimeloyl-ACP methyl ester carboxylesterase